MAYMGFEEIFFTVSISVISGVASALTIKLLEYWTKDELIMER